MIARRSFSTVRSTDICTFISDRKALFDINQDRSLLQDAALAIKKGATMLKNRYLLPQLPRLGSEASPRGDAVDI